MKFTEIVKDLQKLEENKGKTILARCGVFMVAIGKDAIFLNKVFGLKLTCMRPRLCKVGIPLTSTFEYMELMEGLGYSYLIYDYDKSTKKLVLKYKFEGEENPETKNCTDCKKCQYYKEHGSYNNIDIFDLIEERKKYNNEQK